MSGDPISQELATYRWGTPIACAWRRIPEGMQFRPLLPFIPSERNRILLLFRLLG